MVAGNGGGGTSRIESQPIGVISIIFTFLVVPAAARWDYTSPVAERTLTKERYIKHKEDIEEEKVARRRDQMHAVALCTNLRGVCRQWNMILRTVPMAVFLPYTKHVKMDMYTARHLIIGRVGVDWNHDVLTWKGIDHVTVVTVLDRGADDTRWSFLVRLLSRAKKLRSIFSMESENPLQPGERFINQVAQYLLGRLTTVLTHLKGALNGHTAHGMCVRCKNIAIWQPCIAEKCTIVEDQLCMYCAPMSWTRKIHAHRDTCEWTEEAEGADEDSSDTDWGWCGFSHLCAPCGVMRHNLQLP